MFVTFEGPEGSGKSTAIKAVSENLNQSGIKVVTTREPGAGKVGQAIREILLHGEELDPKAELFLFLADRAQHVASLIRPALNENRIVLCDRFTDSTVAYQGHARGLDVEELRRLNDVATGNLKPDLTLLFDLDVEVGLRRVTDQDRLDKEPLEFHQKVRDGYHKEMKADPQRWAIIDASRPIEAVIESCLWVITTSHAFD